MKANPKVSADKLAEIVGISKQKIEENIAKLKKIGLDRKNWRKQRVLESKIIK